MGWAARKRGTYEQRKANAMIRDRDIIKARKIEEAKRVASMTPAERAKSRNIRTLITMASVWNQNRMKF